MPDVSWIIIKADFTDNRKFILLEYENPKHRDLAIAVWVKLLTMAARLNGFICYDEDTPYTLQKLSVLLKRKPKQIEIALDLLKKYNLIEVDEKFLIKIHGWDKHQNTEGIEKIREAVRERVRKCRLGKKNKELDVTCDVTVTPGNAQNILKTKENKIEEEIKEKENKELRLFNKKMKILSQCKDEISSKDYTELKKLLDRGSFKEFDKMYMKLAAKIENKKKK
ncbi:MAG: phage replisome organizer N-terminal domain-containing protein [Ignavibacteriales bacterium]|nr:phage replisome organizer N-terminal domain-containing protein [Ignavibacteriales bacterium]